MYTLRRHAQLALFRTGLVLNRAVHDWQIQHFLESIRPVKTPLELIRIGSGNDGGYLVPDDFVDENIGAVLSPGVGSISDFELYFASRGVPCVLVDKSVESLPVSHPKFRFMPLFLAASSNREKGKISLEDLISEVSMSKEVGGKDLILQMDIEGAEWEVLSSVTTRVLKRFRFMVVEFHDLAVLLSSRASHQIVVSLFERLLKDFYVLHIHVNNTSPTPRIRGALVPNVIEMTLGRKDRIDKLRSLKDSRSEHHTPLSHACLPNAKDLPNNPAMPESALPQAWKCL